MEHGLAYTTSYVQKHITPFGVCSARTTGSRLAARSARISEAGLLIWKMEDCGGENSDVSRGAQLKSRPQ